MESNEITIFMDAKLEIHGKRPASLKYKGWTRCLVKVEAIKCLPSFLRINFARCRQTQRQPEENEQLTAEFEEEAALSVCINVPGVTVSQAESRTKEHTYGLFWKQNRRDCYIYFAIDTEAEYRRHIKWIKRQIKQLELHRSMILEQRRISNATGCGMSIEADANMKQANAKITAPLGPLPQIPTLTLSPQHDSRVSEIYEEIFEPGTQLDFKAQATRASGRLSRSSVASGIYEEMKPTNGNFQAIVEEVLQDNVHVQPPLPPPRKRINTFEGEQGDSELLGDIPRSNTNPDTIKKKRYRQMLQIFGVSARSNRAVSVSECSTANVLDLLQSQDDLDSPQPIYENSIYTQHNDLKLLKRNSFSSPDLSKINLLAAYNDEQTATALKNSFTNSADFDLSVDFLLEERAAQITPLTETTAPFSAPRLPALKAMRQTLLSEHMLNISEQISTNFNASACNSSSINLVGANGADLDPTAAQRNKIMNEDSNGYCVMAPIVKKTNANGSTANAGLHSMRLPSTTSSGYSTASYCSSSASSCTNSTEDNSKDTLTTDKVELRRQAQPQYSNISDINEVSSAAEESAVYEKMLVGTTSSFNSSGDAAKTVTMHEFTGHLYENLLEVKAAQELASTAAPMLPKKLSTSTPTAAATEDTDNSKSNTLEEAESFYHTPRKSIISVDEKVPSYYPNSCDTGKMRRSQSPNNAKTANNNYAKIYDSPVSIYRHSANTAQARRERKENRYISSPAQVMKSQESPKAVTPTTASGGSQRSANKNHKKAHKVSENLYNVTHAKNSPITMRQTSDGGVDQQQPEDKLQQELKHLAVLQNIDFKFDDTNEILSKTPTKTCRIVVNTIKMLDEEENAQQLNAEKQQHVQPEQFEEIENCYETYSPAQKSSFKSPHTKKITPSKQILQQIQQPVEMEARSRATTAVSKLGVFFASVVGDATTYSSSSSSSAGSNGTGQEAQQALSASKKFASMPRFKKIDFSPLRLRINNVLQRHQ